MKRVATFFVVVLVAMGVSAQDQPSVSEEPSETSEVLISHGEFAVVLLNAVAGFGYHYSDPVRALDETIRLGLTPNEWLPEEPLTHGEFAAVLEAMGVVYVPSDRDEEASREFVEAMLRRKMWVIRDYLYVMYHRPGPIVSPSQFEQ